MSFLNSVISFKSNENPYLWDIYLDGLKTALSRYSVDKTILSTVGRDVSDDTYVIISQSSDGRLMGGIRIELKSENNKIPLEKIKSKSSDLVANTISSYYRSNYQIGEVCGFWTSDVAKKTGLGKDLILRITQLGIRLNLQALVAMLPQHTLNGFLEIGYVVDSDLPKFVYPDERYLSTVVWYHVPRVIKETSRESEI